MTPYRVGTYAAGANGQAVQMFGNGAVQTMTAQIRAIKSDATEGTAVGGQRRAAGSTSPGLGQRERRLVAAWTLDTAGDRTDRPRRDAGLALVAPETAIVLQTDGQSVSDVATVIDASGNGVVAWIESPRSGPGADDRQGRDLRPGLAPQIATLDTRENASLAYLSLGLDSTGRPTVTWAVNPAAGPRC